MKIATLKYGAEDMPGRNIAYRVLSGPDGIDCYVLEPLNAPGEEIAIDADRVEIYETPDVPSDPNPDWLKIDRDTFGDRVNDIIMENLGGLFRSPESEMEYAEKVTDAIVAHLFPPSSDPRVWSVFCTMDNSQNVHSWAEILNFEFTDEEVGLVNTLSEAESMRLGDYIITRVK